jgi:hypothetical protein
MMEDLLGYYYTMDGIREETSAHHYGEEAHKVQYLVEQPYVPKNSHRHVHCPLRIDLLVI